MTTLLAASLSLCPSPHLFLVECRSHAPNFPVFYAKKKPKIIKNKKKAKKKKPNENIKYAKWKKLAH